MKLTGKRGLGLLLALMILLMMPVNVFAEDAENGKVPKTGWRYVKGYKLYYDNEPLHRQLQQLPE